MTSPATRLQQIRTLRSQVEIMYQAVAAPTKLPGRISGSMAIKMAYEQIGREEYANRFRRVLENLDKHEQEILAEVALEEVSAS